MLAREGLKLEKMYGDQAQANTIIEIELNLTIWTWAQLGVIRDFAQLGLKVFYFINNYKYGCEI